MPFALDASVRVLDDGGLLCLLRELDRQAPGTLDAAFDAMPIGMALFNTDGEYVRVNAALCALLARPEHELIGMRDNLLTHPDDRQSDIDAAWRILRGEFEHLAVREALRAPGRRASSGRWPTSPSCATSTAARCAGSGSSRTSPSCAGWRCATR